MTADPAHITNWQRIDPRLTTSGQPSEPQLAEIAALGVTHVVNLALHDHEQALPDEAGAVAALGMAYIHIPVVFDRPTEADFDRFAAVMDTLREATVHVHCIMNMRVTAFLYRYDRDVRPIGGDAARRALDRVWRPGGVWAAFIGDEASIALPHRAPRTPD